MLDETDFNRMELTTGQRKQIIKIQRTIPQESGDAKNKTEQADDYYEYEFIDQAGPSHISLEKVIITHINRDLVNQQHFRRS